MFLEERGVRPPGLREVRNNRTGAVLASAVELALTRATRNRGLLGRDSLPAGHGLLIAPCWSIHTFFMRFAIDVVFVTRDGRVVKVRRNVRPWRIAVGPGAYAVLELPAGALSAAAVHPRDQLELRTVS
jgi:uncharacterized membrane protein (UPF0127 family)